MICLKFPLSAHEAVSYARISKPRLNEVLRTALSKRYSNTMAAKYSEKAGDFLYSRMDFPIEGIYCIDSKTGCFKVYSVEKNDWEDTGKSKKDYCIDGNKRLWKDFFEKYPFLKKAEGVIKQAVRDSTETMFDGQKWSPLCNLELSTGVAIQAQEDVRTLAILEKYFSNKRLLGVHSSVRQAMFGRKRDDFVLLTSRGKLVAILCEDGAHTYNSSNLNEVEKLFKEELEDGDLENIILRLKNCLLFGSSEARFEILYKDQDGYHISLWGKDYIVAEDGIVYYKCTDEVLEDIAEEVRKVGVQDVDFSGQNSFFRRIFVNSCGIVVMVYYVAKQYGAEVNVFTYSIENSPYSYRLEEIAYLLYDKYLTKTQKRYYYRGTSLTKEKNNSRWVAVAIQ